MPDQPVSTVISSSCLKTRDKAIQEKHQDELAALERKVNKLKWANRDALNQLFDANNRGHNLATSIGFNDIYQALSVVSSSRPQTSYIANIERGKALEEEVIKRTAENDRLRDELDKMREERDVLKSQLDVEREDASAKTDEKLFKRSPGTQDDDVASPLKTDVHRLCLELATLRARYDALLDVKQRLVARYKRDYKKWNAFKEWLLWDDASDRKSKLEGGDKSPEEEKKRNIANVLRKRKMLLSMGLNKAPINEDIVDDSNKENNRFPITQNDNKRPLMPMAPVASDVADSLPLVPHSLNHLDLSSSYTPSPTRSVSGNVKQKEHSSPHSTLKRRHSGKTSGHKTLPGSLDTEDEPQVPDAAYLASVSVPAPIILRPSTPVLPEHALPKTDGCHQLSNTATPDTERPKKIRRVSPHADNELTDSSASRIDVGGWEMFTPADKTREKGKEKEKQDITLRTPAAPNTGKLLDDYSAYKGRGRYAKDTTSADKTINALYAIDPKQNGGLDFQFDEVVRNKDDRKKLNGGDCECCREYYEAVGPLPKRLQKPLWRSPPTSPVKQRPCQQHQQFDTSHQQAISDHKQAISRHRHRWARASTPPDYWNIGFPSTQETANINKRAKEMHKAKRDNIEGEIEMGNGKYKKR